MIISSVHDAVTDLSENAASAKCVFLEYDCSDESQQLNKENTFLTQTRFLPISSLNFLSCSQFRLVPRHLEPCLAI